MRRKLLCVILASGLIISMFPIPVVGANNIIVKEITSGLEYSSIYWFNEGLALVQKDGECGFIDKTGKEIIPCGVYDDFFPEFHEGLTAAKKDGKWGFIDKTNKVLIPFEYDYAYWFSEGLASVRKDGKQGFIDKTGKLTIPCVYDVCGTFTDGLAVAWKDGKSGYIDNTGKIVVPIGYDGSKGFSENLMAVQKDGKWGYVDRTGKLIILCTYDYAGDFHEGLAYVGKDGMSGFGYIDKTGKIVIPLEYHGCSDFEDGFAFVSKYNQWSIINKTGELVVPFKSFSDYWFTFTFYEGTALAWKDDKFGYVDRTGELIVPCIYDSGAMFFREGLAYVVKDKKIGFIDKTGKVIVPFEYDEAALYPFSDSLTAIRKGDKWSILEIQKPTEPEPLIAVPTTSAVLVNSENKSFDAYNINGNNYFKLRDLAYVLSGTRKQFDVGWDSAKNAISLTSGKSYTVVGGEMSAKSTGNKTAMPTTSKIYLNGNEINLTAYNIDGNNYFKLRDIGQMFNFGVTWNSEKNTIVIDTNMAYMPVV